MRFTQLANLRAKDIKYIRKLHNLVIHKKRGTNKQYFLESKKIAQLADDAAEAICGKCFRCH